MRGEVPPSKRPSRERSMGHHPDATRAREFPRKMGKSERGLLTCLGDVTQQLSGQSPGPTASAEGLS